MTPQIKAKQIIDEMQFAIIERDGVLYSGIKKDVSQMAAIIVIENILRTDKDIDTIPFSIYWSNVMNEIQKL
jgi:hypothetical protein